MADDGVTIGRDSFGRARRAVQRSESTPVGPTVEKPLASRRQANRQFVKPTGQPIVDNGVRYWPATLFLRNETSQTWKTLGDVWASDANNESLTIGKYHSAVQAGARALVGAAGDATPRPCFVTNIICCGSGSTGSDCNGCTDGQIVGSPIFLRVLNVQEFDVTDGVGRLLHPDPPICLSLHLCQDFNGDGIASVSAPATLGQILGGTLSMVTTFAVSRVNGAPRRYSVAAASEFFVNGGSAGVSLGPFTNTTSDCNLLSTYTTSALGSVVDYNGTHRLQWRPVYSIDGQPCPFNPMARGMLLSNGIPPWALPENRFLGGCCG